MDMLARGGIAAGDPCAPSTAGWPAR